MPPKKKQQPRNAFYFFMIDWKREKEEQGQRFSNLKEVADLCGEDWKHLPENLVKFYKEQEKSAKNDKLEKYDSLGTSFTEKERKNLEELNARQKMHDDIDNTLGRLTVDLDRLKNHFFYLAHVNFYCFHTPKEEPHKYIPCEVGLAKFSLKDGVVDTYHAFPVPFTRSGGIPLGYRSEVREREKSVHGVKEPSEMKDEQADWDKMRQEIFTFLEMKQNGPPPIYTMPGDDANTNFYETAVNHFFEFLLNGLDYEVRVYNLSLLLYKLKGVCVAHGKRLFNDDDPGFMVEGVAHTQMLRDIYNFASGLACDYHEEEGEHYHNCSLSIVKRWVFLISEFCCPVLRIELIPGQHCLRTAKITYSAPNERKNFSTVMCSKSDDLKEDDDDNASWSTVTKLNKMRLNPENGSVLYRPPSTQNTSVVVRDRSKEPDPYDTRVYKTGQSPNVVSEILPNLRRPMSRGRGELLTWASQQAKPSFSQDDFPAIGGAKPGRSGWGRGIPPP